MTNVCSKCGQTIQTYEEWRGWSVHVAKHLVTGPMGTVKVPRDSAAAMHLLIKAKGEVVCKEAMIIGVFGSDLPDDPSGRIYNALCKLRNAIGRDSVQNAWADGWYLEINQ